MPQEIWTIKRCLDWTSGYLGKFGDERPRLSGEWLLSSITGLSRTELYMKYDRPLDQEELAWMHQAVARRAKGEPLQYITGEAAFRTITVACEPGVLIPRPETEVLVEEVLTFLDDEVLGGASAPEARERAVLPWNAEVEAARKAEEEAARAAAATLRAGQAGDTRFEPGSDAASAERAAGSAQDGLQRSDATQAVEDFPLHDLAGFGAEDSTRGHAIDGDARGGASPDWLGESADGNGWEGSPRVPDGENAMGIDGPSDFMGAPYASESMDVGGPIFEQELAAPRVARVLEVGCGTGCIALSLVVERPGRVICISTDIEPRAVALADRNRATLGISPDVADFRVGNLVSPLARDTEWGTFDVLVSNPPYIPTAELAILPEEVAGYEPALALDGGQDGLDVFRRLLKAAPFMLHEGGLLACELHEESLDLAAELCRAAGMRDVRVVHDLANRPRIILARTSVAATMQG